ncbi:RHS repeat domain-containing protein [Streptomyces sp. NPDC126510]|uniref:RHS repeat domain-containing protein n=1 Tax=Streptomyces sp. NPDC126510 TaxID=3155317 RepID=UPI0033260E41
MRLTKVTAPHGLHWSYTYDAAGRLPAETDFDGRTLLYRRDPTGRLTARVDTLGDVISLTYDPLADWSARTPEARSPSTPTTWRVGSFTHPLRTLN